MQVNRLRQPAVGIPPYLGPPENRYLSTHLSWCLRSLGASQ